MLSTFFATDDGDIVLRAGPQPDSKCDFRVHKLILSLASPVFKDMFAFPQRSDQPPIVEVTDPPEVLDKLLRLIYPGVEPPTIDDLPTLTALLAAADKYNITSVYPILKNALKTFYQTSSFRAYVVACRFGFLEEAKEAAREGNAWSIIYGGISEEVRHISSTDVLRWFQLVQTREKKGRELVGVFLNWDNYVQEGAVCDHGEDGKTFYSCLEKATGDAFAFNPSVGRNDLFAVLDKIPDPPPACKSPPKSGEFYRGEDDQAAFNCPLQPMTIRNHLVVVAQRLSDLNCAMVARAFGNGTGSS